MSRLSAVCSDTTSTLFERALVTMPYTVTLVNPADIPTITTIQWSALRENPLIQTLYPRGPTPELADFTTASYEKASTYSCVRIVKATDDETGQIVAFAKWIFYRQDQQVSEEGAIEIGASQGLQAGASQCKGKTPPRKPPPHCYTRALEEWNSKITKMRKGIMGKRQHTCMSASKHSLSCYFACYSRNLCVLDILHTHPSQQGKGAGTQLVRWGTDLADKEGLQCYVETPVAGYTLFRQSGFQNITEMSIDLGKYKHGLTGYKHIVMIRPSLGMTQPERPPPVPPKNTERFEGDLSERDQVWETSSETDEDEPPTLQYTAEARMLDLRSSNSTGSPKLGSVAAMRASASMRDLRSSTSTGSRLESVSDVRPSSSMKDLRSSQLPQPGSVGSARASMRDMGYSFSTRDLHASASTNSAQVRG